MLIISGCNPYPQYYFTPTPVLFQLHQPSHSLPINRFNLNFCQSSTSNLPANAIKPLLKLDCTHPLAARHVARYGDTSVKNPIPYAFTTKKLAHSGAFANTSCVNVLVILHLAFCVMLLENTNNFALQWDTIFARIINKLRFSHFFLMKSMFKTFHHQII